MADKKSFHPIRPRLRNFANLRQFREIGCIELLKLFLGTGYPRWVILHLMTLPVALVVAVLSFQTYATFSITYPTWDGSYTSSMRLVDRIAGNPWLFTLWITVSI
jgi:hypothetical protein